MDTGTKVLTESVDIQEETITELKRLMPLVFSEDKIDFDKLKLTLGEDLDEKEERYSFNWAGRKEAFKNIQTTAKGTLIPAPEESINFDSTENLFIEGDNLEVLKLLQKSYFNMVKMIYIDPPYNTGKDFVYKDNFKNSIESYLEQTGQLSEEGVKLTTNPETSGRFHSDWLSMMYPRLFIARNLLRDDGVIFVSIDDNEVHNLRMVMNEIFGEENFITTIIWEKVHTRKNSAKYFSVSHDYILTYAKNKEFWKRNLISRNDTLAYKNPDNDPKGPWKPDPIYANNPYGADYVITKPNGVKLHRPEGKYWRFSEKNIKKFIEEGKIIWGDNNSYPMAKRYLSEVQDGLVPVTLFDREYAGDNSKANGELKDLFDLNKILDYPKPSLLIKRLIEIATNPNDNDIIIDFFAGSGTTAQSVLEFNQEIEGNRKFLCIQLPEATSDSTVAYSAGYYTVAEICKERIRRVIKKIEDKNKEKLINNSDLGFKVFKLQPSNYKVWEDYDGKDSNELKGQLTFFKSPLVDNYKNINVIYECIIKEGYNLNSKIEKTDLESNVVYKVTDEELSFYVCLDSVISDETIENLPLEKENVFICIDDALNDTKKSNLTLQCNLKTI